MVTLRECRHRHALHLGLPPKPITKTLSCKAWNVHFNHSKHAQKFRLVRQYVVRYRRNTTKWATRCLLLILVHHSYWKPINVATVFRFTLILSNILRLGLDLNTIANPGLWNHLVQALNFLFLNNGQWGALGSLLKNQNWLVAIGFSKTITAAPTGIDHLRIIPQSQLR